MHTLHGRPTFVRLSTTPSSPSLAPPPAGLHTASNSIVGSIRYTRVSLAKQSLNYRTAPRGLSVALPPAPLHLRRRVDSWFSNKLRCKDSVFRIRSYRPADQAIRRVFSTPFSDRRIRTSRCTACHCVDRLVRSVAIYIIDDVDDDDGQVGVVVIPHS